MRATAKVLNPSIFFIVHSRSKAVRWLIQSVAPRTDTHHRGKTLGTLAKDGSGLLAKTEFSTDFLD